MSHDPHQPLRVGGRILSLPLGTEAAVVTAPLSPDPSDQSLSLDKADLQAEQAEAEAEAESLLAAEAGQGRSAGSK